MMTLASSGLYLAILKSQQGNIIGSIITFYLIATAWLAGHRKDTGTLDRAALVVGIGGAAATFALAMQSLRNPAPDPSVAPAGMSFLFCFVLLTAVAEVMRHPSTYGAYGWRFRQLLEYST